MLPVCSVRDAPGLYRGGKGGGENLTGNVTSETQDQLTSSVMGQKGK
jgi:hypothetical protein